MELRHRPLTLRSKPKAVARVAGRSHLARVGDSGDDFNWFLLGGAAIGGVAGWFLAPQYSHGALGTKNKTTAHVLGALGGAFAGGLLGIVAWPMYEGAIHSGKS
jgi:uncharacterized protein YcfJ